MLPRKSRIEEREAQNNAESKNWEPKIFKRKPDLPALHEVLQKPAVLEVTPTEAWPIGWKLVSVSPRKGGIKTLYPIVTLGDFSYISVLLCPECGHVLRGLGKGVPVVCMECGFPSTAHGWRRGNDG